MRRQMLRDKTSHNGVSPVSCCIILLFNALKDIHHNLLRLIFHAVKYTVEPFGLWIKTMGLCHKRLYEFYEASNIVTWVPAEANRPSRERKTRKDIVVKQATEITD